MEPSSLGLGRPHEATVAELLHFFRFKRAQSVKALESTFDDVIESRLVEDTFTSDEVREMLAGLCAVVKGDLDSELINTSHTHVLLLRQLFQQAEKWHLTLKADVSVLENQELLEAIAQFERSTVAGQPSATPTRVQLEPMNSAGGDKLLQLEIRRLEENKKLNERIHILESKASSALSERDRLKSDLVASTSRQQTGGGGGGGGGELRTMQEKVEQLQEELAKSQLLSEDSALRDQLAQTTHELQRTTGELERTKQELDRKFSETSQYVTLRKMLASKNEQIKQLREQLSAKE